MLIHPTAIVSPKAQLDPSVKVGPYCVIEENVTIGPDCVLHPHVVIAGRTTIGTANEFFPFASIGRQAQDLKPQPEETSLEIGDHNSFRESCTVNRGTSPGLVTRIGSHNLLLAYSHIAHDCQVGNRTIFANSATLAGHCVVEDWVIISGLTAVHQFTRIGAHAMVGGCSRIIYDVAPFTIVEGNPASVRGLNLVGLKRRGFSHDEIRALRTVYKRLFLKTPVSFESALQELEADPLAQEPSVAKLITFIRSSKRSVFREE
jgi:UDP-N-acetylglucosamine acyltransferase